MEPYRILVTGSRDWADADVIWGALKQVCDTKGTGRVVIVHGKCPRGADALAAQYADMWGIRQEPHPARWREFGKAAGFRRNAEMVKLGADVCLAFIRNGSRGASHCAAAAEKAHIPVRLYTPDETGCARCQNLDGSITNSCYCREEYAASLSNRKD